jgi:hypothetical protein
MTGTQVARNEYIPTAPADRGTPPWTARPGKDRHSFGERVALEKNPAAKLDDMSPARESEARERYEASLRLRHDVEVERWCLRLMATIGPL